MVSVICPIKNEEPFIVDCIDSVISQSLNDWELLLIDDNSVDRSFAIINEYAKNDSRIQAISNNGFGIIAALKTGYEKASGKFISRMDADDLMHPNKLEIMLYQLKEYGKGNIATSLVEYFSEDGVQEGFKNYEAWLNGLTRKGENFKDIYKECVIPSPSWMMYKEDFVAINGFDDLIYPEDYHLVFKIYEAGINVIPSKEVLHYWRDHQNRASRNDINYTDNTFIPLKVSYFLKLDYNSSVPLYLWGAGKKGKKIAQQLLENNLDFQWVCDNPNKWGKDIYGIEMQEVKALSNIKKSQCIIAVAGPEDQKEIKTILKKSPHIHPYFFC